MLARCRVDLTGTDLGEGRAQTMSDEAIADLNRIGVLPRGSSRRIHVHPSRAEQEPIMLPPGDKEEVVASAGIAKVAASLPQSRTRHRAATQRRWVVVLLRA